MQGLHQKMDTKINPLMFEALIYQTYPPTGKLKLWCAIHANQEQRFGNHMYFLKQVYVLLFIRF